MYKSIKELVLFIRDIYLKRGIIWELTKTDLKSRFASSFLGIIWAFVQPMVTIFVFWFVFENGFRVPPQNNFPFFLWLCTGMIPWFFFNDGLSQASNAIREKSFLVKKVVFRVSILPIIKIYAALLIHVFFLFLLFVLYILYGISPNVVWLQVFYYLACMIVLMLGVSWFTSAAVVFLGDMKMVVDTGLQILFWATPIFWTLKILPEKYHVLFRLNPLVYIIEGFRDSFITGVWFWQKPELSLYFWGVNIFIFISGAVIFKNLRPHFADVL